MLLDAVVWYCVCVTMAHEMTERWCLHIISLRVSPQTIIKSVVITFRWQLRDFQMAYLGSLSLAQSAKISHELFLISSLPEFSQISIPYLSDKWAMNKTVIYSYSYTYALFKKSKLLEDGLLQLLIWRSDAFFLVPMWLWVF